MKLSTQARKALDIDVPELTGVRYKILDDLVDGIFCAYLAYYFWYWGEDRTWIVGDREDGYVALPRCDLSTCQMNGNPVSESVRKLTPSGATQANT